MHGNETTRVSFRLRAQETYAITGNPEENCDVILNGAEKVNHGTKKHGSAFACVYREPMRNRQPRRLGSVLPSSNAINLCLFLTLDGIDTETLQSESNLSIL